MVSIGDPFWVKLCGKSSFLAFLHGICSVQLNLRSISYNQDYIYVL